MPKKSPFYPRTSALCLGHAYKEWSGYVAVCNYDRHSEREYFAFRHTAGLLDATPLYKYEVTGPDAGRFLSRAWTRDLSTLKPGRVTYAAMCDEQGKLLDDGTVARLGPDRYRVATSEPWMHWYRRLARGLDVGVEDTTDRVACLALQGPLSRDTLRSLVDFDIDAMRFFAVRPGKLAGVPVEVSRTGYTGDLGFEVWMRNDDALRVWDEIVAAGHTYGLEPCGLDALDVVRIEAGFVLQGVDYISSRNCLIEARKSSPFEASLGFAVNLDREPFIGQDALRREAQAGSKWELVGLELSWPALERLHDEYGLPPHLAPVACRLAVPIYDRLGRQVGQATSTTWSPLLKRYLAIGQVLREHAALGNELRIEYTVDYQRRKLPVTVVKKPFFDPERKRHTPNAPSPEHRAPKPPTSGAKSEAA
jgi:aminomethyltransferase